MIFVFLRNLTICNMQKDIFIIILYINVWCLPFNFFFLEMKTTQNKSKGCLSNTLFNQISLNKKKSNQTRSKY